MPTVTCKVAKVHGAFFQWFRFCGMSLFKLYFILNIIFKIIYSINIHYNFTQISLIFFKKINCKKITIYNFLKTYFIKLQLQNLLQILFIISQLLQISFFNIPNVKLDIVLSCPFIFRTVGQVYYCSQEDLEIFFSTFRFFN